MNRLVRRLVGGILLASLCGLSPGARAKANAAPPELNLSVEPWDLPASAAPAAAAEPSAPTKPPFKPTPKDEGIRIQPYIYDTREDLPSTGRARAERLEPQLGQGKVERRLEETGFGVRLIRPF